MKEHIRERLVFQDAKIKNYDIHLISIYAVEESQEWRNLISKIRFLNSFSQLTIALKHYSWK